MTLPRPEWLTLSSPEDLDTLKYMLDGVKLHTVCEGADCPNIGECFKKKNCTFMILGDICTRNCRFCAVKTGVPSKVNTHEPKAVALTAKQLGLKHVVVTSVTRDDLDDGGAAQFAFTIQAIREEIPNAFVEVLIPDFKGSRKALEIVIEAEPEVINHNIETVPSLYAQARPQAKYERSLELLARVSNSDKKIMSKTGLMLGLGETKEEVIKVMSDLVAVGCEILTLGQYLSPSPNHLPIIEYIKPDVFKEYEEIAYKMGFLGVSAGPLVRSSYKAREVYEKVLKKRGEIHG